MIDESKWIDYFHKIFTIYFRDQNHPNNISSKNLIDEWRK